MEPPPQLLESCFVFTNKWSSWRCSAPFLYTKRCRGLMPDLLHICDLGILSIALASASRLVLLKRYLHFLEFAFALYALQCCLLCSI